MGLAVLCGICVMMAGCRKTSGFYLDQQADTSPEESGSMKDTEERISQSAEGEAEASAGWEAAEPPRIYVQVSGAVAHPGVYELAEGSRIFEAIELAGGLTGQADQKRLNQAQPAVDGQMVYVYALGESEDEAAEASVLEEEEQDGRVDLNTASVQQLMTLPGIGQAKAEGIVSYREAHGSFEKIEDIMEIEGIKEGVFSKIKDQIKVD